MSTKISSTDNSEAEEGRFGNTGMERANSVRMPRLPKTLTAEEKKYLMAVDRGDIAAVKRMIGRSPMINDLNVNCVDPLGRGALLMAIEAQNITMVETLIVMGVRTGDSLLHAIDKQFVEAVELLLEHEELVHKDGEPYSWEDIDRDTATFTPEITPLILASHRNNYEILKILLDRGATIPMPHDIRCVCGECAGGVKEDSLRHSASRINSYKALASPSLIALTSTDPLLTSFELSWELKQLSVSEYEFRSDYLELRKKSQEFAVSLLGHTRTSHELRVMLNYDPTMNDEEATSSPDADLHECGLARLRLAIKYKQKKFVAHPWVQQLLASMWYDGLPGFRQKTTVGKCLEILKIILAFPLYCLWYMLAPKSRTGKLMRKPFMKFLTHASSYLLFLLILILVSQRVEEQVIDFLKDFGYLGNVGNSLRKRQRGNPPQILEYFVFIYVIGFILEETRELFRNGFFSYVSDLWNAIDFLRNALYCFVAALRIWAYVEQQKEISANPEKAYIPREDWDDFDPQLIAEGLFAAANIFSALKLVHVSTINPHLGPLQISLGRMVYDILKFFFFYTLVLFAFACGLNQLLWYFADLEKQKCYSLPGDLPDWKNSGEACMKWRRFGNLFESSQSLFWASFGMVGLADFELTGIKSYTRFWGLLMFGSYCVINVIVLLNLLIAMLSNTYAEIAERADTEWKFARTKLWLSYFDEDATLPSPFNLVPTPKQVKRLLTRFIPTLAKIGTSLKHREARTTELKEQARQYTAVMRALVWRYVSGFQRRSEEEQVTEDDVNEVKGEISSLRCDLIEVFRRNGMNVSSITDKPVAAGRRTREWERRLLRGFHVAPAAGDERMESFDDGMERNEDDEEALREKERVADRFRRMARLALLNRERLSRPPKHLSHIGRSLSSESMKSRQSLKQAIEAAKKQHAISDLATTSASSATSSSQNQDENPSQTSTKAGEPSRPSNLVSSGENVNKENAGKTFTAATTVITTATTETETEKLKSAPPVPSRLPTEKSPGTTITLPSKPKSGTEGKSSTSTPTATPASRQVFKSNVVVPSTEETIGAGKAETPNLKDLNQGRRMSSFDAVPRDDTLISIESETQAKSGSSGVSTAAGIAVASTSSSNSTLATGSTSSMVSSGGESSSGSLGKIDSLPLLPGASLDNVKTIKKQPGSWF